MKILQQLNFWSGDTITKLNPNQIYCFGSNPEGRHGKGAALTARKLFGAVYGVGRGLQGQSYALPTKNLTAGFTETIWDDVTSQPKTITYPKAGVRSIDPYMIRLNVKEMYDSALQHPDLEFLIVYKNEGKNLNGYSPVQMFQILTDNITVPYNVFFHDSFKEIADGHYVQDQQQ